VEVGVAPNMKGINIFTANVIKDLKIMTDNSRVVNERQQEKKSLL
jgi:hypothetical protein